MQDLIHGQRIVLDDPVFENNFSVYGTDAATIKQMISPGLRQWMTDFREKANSLLFFSFKGSRLNIGAYIHKQLFEARIFRKVDDYDFILENFRYLALFNGILEDISRKH